MLGILGGVIIVFWYYYTAKELEKDTTAWAIGGAILYAGSRWLWTYGIVEPILGKTFYRHSGSTGLMIEVSGIAVAILIAAIVKFKFLNSPPN